MNTVIFTTSTPTQPTCGERNRLAIARVAAADRVKADRVAAEARIKAERNARRAQHEALTAEIEAMGGTAVNVKVCFHDGGKLRLGDLEPAVAAYWIVAHRHDADVEASVHGADGEPLIGADGFPVYV